MRELHTLSVDAVVRFDTDSPLGDWIVSTPAINSNLLDFSKSSLPIQLDLGDSNMQTINTNLRLQLPIASIPNAIGSTADDVIYGNGQSNSISGGDGNDLLVGRGGNDQLNGNGGNDELRGLAGNDQLTGGLGNDIYWFEDSVALELDNVIEAVDAGIDRVDFQPSTSNVTFNLGLTSIQNSQLNRSIQMSAGDVIEVLFGSQANDTLTSATDLTMSLMENKVAIFYEVVWETIVMYSMM